MCNIPADKLPFHLFGLCLQEPMGLILNWVMASIAIIMFVRLKNKNASFQKSWRWFFLTFAISTFFGGLGHVFFIYTGFYGKIMSWIMNFIASFFAGKAMIETGLIRQKAKKNLLNFIVAVSFVLLVLTMMYKSFTFVIIDTAIIYFTFCLGFGIDALKKGIPSMKYIIIAVLILIPSAFVFIFKINPYLWFDTNDLSHTFIIISLFFFYFGVVNYRSIGMNGETAEIEK